MDDELFYFYFRHAIVTGIQRPYDLLWPIHHPLGKEQPAKIIEIPSESPGIGGTPGTLARRVCTYDRLTFHT